MQANVRVLAATNVNLAERMASGQFRRDLYYRLSVVPLLIPPLRERREEIPGLACAFLDDLSRRAGRCAQADLDASVVAALQGYGWPGNLRELRNALERSLVISRGEAITLRHLSPEIRGAANTSGGSLRLGEMTATHICRVLEACGGNRTQAAAILGIGRSTLKRNLADLAREGFRIVPPGPRRQSGPSGSGGPPGQQRVG